MPSVPILAFVFWNAGMYDIPKWNTVPKGKKNGFQPIQPNGNHQAGREVLHEGGHQLGVKAGEQADQIEARGQHNEGDDKTEFVDGLTKSISSNQTIAETI